MRRRGAHFAAGWEHPATTQTDNMIHDARPVRPDADPLQSPELAHQWFAIMSHAAPGQISATEACRLLQALWKEQFTGRRVSLSRRESNQDAYMDLGSRRARPSENNIVTRRLFDVIVSPAPERAAHAATDPRRRELVARYQSLPAQDPQPVSRTLRIARGSDRQPLNGSSKNGFTRWGIPAFA